MRHPAGATRALVALILLMTLSCGAPAEPSAAAPQLLELPAVDGSMHAPLEDGGVRVVVFTTTDCPIANAYAPTLRELHRDYSKRGVGLYLVHVDPDVTRDRAAEHARDYDLPATILLDPGHRLVAELGAEITPEAFLFDAAGELRYRGRIDNWFGDVGRKRPRPTRHDLRDALERVLDGREVETTRTEAVGCFIPTP